MTRCDECTDNSGGWCYNCGYCNKCSLFHGYDDCIYVMCDDVGCRALKEPVGLEQVTAALEHWRDHSHLCGCSHGR